MSEQSHETAHVDDAALRALAAAATPGDWFPYVLGSEGYDVRTTAMKAGRLSRPRIARFGNLDWDSDRANAEYVAAAGPQKVLAMLDRLAAVEKLADDLWLESQQDHTIIRDAGVMQDIVYRLRAAIGLPEDPDEISTPPGEERS